MQDKILATSTFLGASTANIASRIEGIDWTLILTRTSAAVAILSGLIWSWSMIYDRFWKDKQPNNNQEEKE